MTDELIPGDASPHQRNNGGSPSDFPEGDSPDAWLDWTSRKQALASDPMRSAWVSANAGSGKTHVLTQRVIRLLLAGCRPSSILCLTYTKAAASEMSNRVFERLSAWATLPDDALKARIGEIEGKAPSRETLNEARRLFARALETPGGLKIQTIHAFCEALLHQFPLEANVAGHFSVLDDRASATLLTDARRALLTATTSEGDTSLGEAFATVLERADDTGLDRLLTQIIASRTALSAFLAAADTHGGIEQTLRTALDLPPQETEQSLTAAFWPLPGLHGSVLTQYLDLATAQGGAKVQDFVYGLKAIIAMDDAETRRDGLLDLFFTQSGKPRADGAFFGKPMVKAVPEVEQWITLARDHVTACNDRLNLFRMFQSTLAALTLAERLNDDYEDLKRKRSQLDFEDLINRTARLLTRSGVSPWVHYKLDQGIDHILVDEAQDTSPVQWTVITSLAEDFFSGKSAREQNRSVFAVGDEKQSIYSFQGARPERFAEERTALARRISTSGQTFSPVNLRLSFRSTADVLTAVDRVFASPSNAQGLSAGDEVIAHASNRIGHAGAVDIWDVIAPDIQPEDDDWTAPFDATPESAPASILARRIAAVLESWIGKETIIEDKKRRLIRPGDIIVLVRKRDGFVNALTRALKKRGNIPVAGADRLLLTSHIAVQDLLALGRFVLLPHDDLSLLALLKSPLFNLSESDISIIGADRLETESAWQSLQRRGDEHDHMRLAAERLKAYRTLSQSVSVHDFFARILGAEGGRRLFLARLGTEVSDILDEFLTFALDHEQNGLPGLQAFVAALEMEAPTVKREQDKERNEIRIMTVHAAKGLEAPIVFLVDGGSKAFHSQHMPSLRLIETPVSAALNTPLPVWLPPGSAGNALIAASTAQMKQSAEDEYRRLLYVGMTRAADRLIVCGYCGKRANPGTWHEMVTQALSSDADHCQPHTFTAGEQEWQGFQWRVQGPDRPIEAAPPAQQRAGGPATLPEDLLKPLPQPKRLPRPLSPSGAGAIIDDGADDLAVGSALFTSKEGPTHSMLRGAILHRFFQVLPTFAPEERMAAAERYIARAAPRWLEDERFEVIDSVLSVIDHEQLVPLFAPGSRAEVSVMGTVKLGRQDFAVSGRIDRLSVVEDTVYLADFKTSREVPKSLQAIDFAYKAQMAIYHALLQPLYPNHRFECLLIYTQGPKIWPVPQTVLSETLAALSTK